MFLEVAAGNVGVVAEARQPLEVDKTHAGVVSNGRRWGLQGGVLETGRMSGA